MFACYLLLACNCRVLLTETRQRLPASCMQWSRASDAKVATAGYRTRAKRPDYCFKLSLGNTASKQLASYMQPSHASASGATVAADGYRTRPKRMNDKFKLALADASSQQLRGWVCSAAANSLVQPH